MSKEQTWRQFASEIGGEFVERGFGPWRSGEVVTRVEQWEITLDSNDVGRGVEGSPGTTYTRLRATHTTPGGFRFEIYPRTRFSGVGKFLGKFVGMQQIEIGHAKFDHEFVVKGDDESKVRALLAKPKIRQAIEAQPHIKFKVATYPYRQLLLEVPELIHDLARLSALHKLFAETLEELHRMSSVSEEARPPNPLDTL